MVVAFGAETFVQRARRVEALEPEPNELRMRLGQNHRVTKANLAFCAKNARMLEQGSE
jgi:hypothetical protein